MAANGIKQHGHANNLRRHPQYNFRFENRTTIPSEHAEGLAYYDSNAGNKHLYYCVDDTVPVYARVLRGDTAETITGLWTFHPDSAGSQPFAVHTNGTGRVDNLNADRVDSFHASQSVVANTLATRNGDGTLSGADPTSNEHFVTLGYVTNLIDNYDPKDPCEAATTGNIDVSSAPATFDGYAASNGDRIFVWQQVAGEENGIRIFQGVGNPMPRSSDADEDNEVTSGMQTFIRGGNTHTGAIFMLKTADPIVLDTDALEFVQVGGNTLYSDGRGLTKSGNTFHAIQSTAYSVGDIVFANSADTLTFLTAVATGNVLKSGGETTAPVWGKVDLTADVTGTLGVTNGGTGNPNQFTKGSVVYASDNGVYSQSNTLFFWDETNNALGLGTKTLTVGNRLQVSLGRIAISDGYNIGDIDGNTGFFVNSDTANIQTAGTTRFKIDASGNAGLGLTTYSSRLTVKDSDDDDFSHGIQIIRSSNADSGYINVQGGALSFNTVNNAGTGALPIQWALNGVVAMKMDTAGNLAINDNPEAGWRLNVGGAIRSDAGEGNVSYGMSGWDFVRWDNTNEIELGGITGSQFQVLNFWTAGAYRGHINAAGTWTLAAPSSGTTLVANMRDNQASAVVFQQGANEYLAIDTLNGGELIVYGNTTTSPRHVFYGDNVSIGGSGGTTLDVISNNANPIRLYRNGVNASLQTENNVGSAYFGINTAGNACIGHVLDQTNAPFQLLSSGVVKLTTVNAGSSNEVLVYSSGSLIEKRALNAGIWATNLGANRLILSNSSGELTSSSSFTYSGPRIGLGNAIDSTAQIVVGCVDDPITTNQTTYEKSIYARALGCYNIATGITDGGYRIALDASAFVSDSDFLGELEEQYAVWARHGANVSGVGSVIVNSYGLYIDSLTNANTTIQNLWALYQANSAAKNYFAGKLGIGVTPGASQLTVSGSVELTGVSTYLWGGDDEILVGQDGSGYYLFAGASAGQGKPILFGSDATEIRFKTAGTEWLNLNSTGVLKINRGSLLVTESDSSSVAVNIVGDIDEGFVQVYANGTQKIDIRGNGNSYFNGGNVGFGTASPNGTGWDESSAVLHIYKNATNGGLIKLESSNTAAILNAGNNQLAIFTLTADPIRLGTNGTESLRIDLNQNLGIGTTDIENWGGGSYKAIEFPNASIMFGSVGNIDTYYSSNAYYDGSWKYKKTSPASQMILGSGGDFLVRTAPSGTIDTAITWTTALTVNNDGTLSISTPYDLWNTIGPDSVKFARETEFGGSASYKVLQIGEAVATRAIAIGADVSANLSLAFTGNEVIFPVDRNIITPNVANNAYLGLFGIDSAEVLHIGSPTYNVKGGGRMRVTLSTGALWVNGELTLNTINTSTTDNNVLVEASGVVKRRTIYSGAWSGGAKFLDFQSVDAVIDGTDLDTESNGLYENYGGNYWLNEPAGAAYGAVWSQVRPADNLGFQLFFDIRSGQTDYGNLFLRTKNTSGWATWSKIWHDGNDGPGSGLHADLFDGQEGSYYLTASNIGGLGNSRVVVTDGTGKLTSDSALLWNGDGLAIGTSVSALLTLGGGATTKAPLKFTAGPLLTTPQVGAVEFSNESEPALYFTRKAGARKRICLVHEEDIGDGTNSTFTVTHDLGAKPVSVVATFNATGEEFVPDWDIVDDNTISVTYLEVLAVDEVSIRVAA